MAAEKERAKDRWRRSKSDGAQVRVSPHPDLGASQMGNTVAKAMQSNKEGSHGCLRLGPREHIQMWRKLGADKALLQAIEIGIQAPITRIPQPSNNYQVREGIDLVLPAIEEYLADGAIRKLTAQETERTKYWVPIFPREKANGKVRVITDLRELNRCSQTPRHKAETWRSVLQVIADETLQWAITLDIKGYHHHLGIHPKTQRWMRFRVGTQGFQIQAMPFGWSLSPWWANKFSKPIRGWLNQQQWAHCWWVDDILLLGPTKEETERRAVALIQLLTQLGVTANGDKSMTRAQQQVTYVGQRIDLRNNKVSSIPEKNQISVTMVRKQIKGSTFQPRNMAALAGNLGDTAKANAALHGLPQQIMKHAALGVAENARRLHTNNKHACWGSATLKTPQLKEALQRCLHALENPIPKVFRATNALHYTLCTDASDVGWGAQLSLGGKEIHTCAQTWSADEQSMHITHREALASALAVQHLRQNMKPGSTLTLKTDASSTAWAWRKGSKNKAMNELIARTLHQLHRDSMHLEAQHIPGITNKRADWLSRNPDPKNYMLSKEVFQLVCRRMKFQPVLDLFASKDNKQLAAYCSWRTDRKSHGNAFSLNWSKQPCWLNPPWDLIPQALHKIQQDHATCLACLPIWKTAPWWRTMLGLQRGIQLEVHGQTLFQDPRGKNMPPPRWGTLFTVLQG